MRHGSHGTGFECLRKIKYDDLIYFKLEPGVKKRSLQLRCGRKIPKQLEFVAICCRKSRTTHPAHIFEGENSFYIKTSLPEYILYVFFNQC